jgi:hypothetical protein
MQIEPSETAFAECYRRDEPQVVWTTLVADLETAVSAFLKLGDGKAMSFLLESVEGGAVRGRYSIIGLEPDLVWRTVGGRAEINRTVRHKAHGFGANGFLPCNEEPLAALRALIAESRIDLPETLPPMAAGIFGYLGYDMVRLMEELPQPNPDPIGIPDAVLIRPTIVVVFDAVKDTLTVVTPVRPESGSGQAGPQCVCASATPGRRCWSSRLIRPAVPSSVGRCHWFGMVLQCPRARHSCRRRLEIDLFGDLQRRHIGGIGSVENLIGGRQELEIIGLTLECLKVFCHVGIDERLAPSGRVLAHLHRLGHCGIDALLDHHLVLGQGIDQAGRLDHRQFIGHRSGRQCRGGAGIELPANLDPALLDPRWRSRHRRHGAIMADGAANGDVGIDAAGIAIT